MEIKAYNLYGMSNYIVSLWSPVLPTQLGWEGLNEAIVSNKVQHEGLSPTKSIEKQFRFSYVIMRS